MSKIITFLKTFFSEVGKLFTDPNYRETMKRDFFYSIYYHWTALTLSARSTLNKKYLITTGVLLVIFVGIHFGIQPYQDTIIDFIIRYVNPVADSTDQVLDNTKVEDTGTGFSFLTLFSIFSSIGISSLKEYYKSFFTREALGYFFSFEIYKYVIITLARPVLADLIENVRYLFLQGTEPTSRKETGLWENYKRSLKLSFYSLSMQLILTVLLFPFAPFSTLLISWYFTGVMLMDNYTRSRGLNAIESHQEAWKHKWYAVGTGFTFNALNFIPYVGPVVAPILSSVASGIGLYEIEKEEKSEKTTDKELAFLEVEKQSIEFGKDFNTGIDISTTFKFIKSNALKLRYGTGMNLLVVVSIWVGIFYFLFHYTTTSKLLSTIFPLYKPELNTNSELEAATSFFDSIGHFITVFMVLFLFGFTLYRFLVFLIHTQFIYSNSILIQTAHNNGNETVPINRIELLINNFFTMILEMLLIWLALYCFLMSSGYSLLICLGLFLCIDAFLIGSLLVSTRNSMSKLSFFQKAEVLWQHKGFVLATGVVYLLTSYVPFAALRYTPTLAVATAEIAIKKINLEQTILYVKNKKKIKQKNG